MGKRWRKAAVVVVLVAVVVWAAVADRRPTGLPPLKPLDDAVGPEVAAGWRVVRPPELPGPYRRVATPFQTPKGGGGEGWWRNKAGDARQKLTPEPGVEQMAVPLETVDGRITVAVLAR